MTRATHVLVLGLLVSILAGCGAAPAKIGSTELIIGSVPITKFTLATLGAIAAFALVHAIHWQHPAVAILKTITSWIAGCLFVMSLTGWILFPANIYDFRVTIDVDVDGSTRSGSSVIRIIHERGPFPNNPVTGTGGSFTVIGTAPIVDLGPYGTLIASLEGGDSVGKQRQSAFPKEGRYPLHTVAYHGEPKARYNLGPRTIDPQWFPNFIWLPPNKDPEDAKPLLPSEFSANIAPGVHLVTIRIAPSQGSVAEIVANPPEWLVSLRSLGGTPVQTQKGKVQRLGVVDIETGYRQWLTPKR